MSTWAMQRSAMERTVGHRPDSPEDAAGQQNAPGAATLAYIRDDIGRMRDALMTALGRDH